jgi:Signal transduction histidine kinase
LTNTLKYAHARKFETRISYKAKELRLELRDDGDGFKVKDRHDGVGLAGMRERVEQMGGELEITSSRGKGTRSLWYCLVTESRRHDIKKKTAAKSNKRAKKPNSVQENAEKKTQKNLVSRFSSLMITALSAKAWFHSSPGKQT